MLYFPPFRLDLEAQRLWKEDQEVHLRRKPFAILNHLVQHPHRLVTHGEIALAIWGNAVTCEGLLRNHIRAVRVALGEDLIQTVVGRGYRFVADVSHVDAEGRPVPGALSATWQTSPANVIGREAELDALRAALRSACHSGRTAVFLTGEAGAGKTTVADAFLRQATAEGSLLVGVGTCVEQHGGGQAYLPFLDAVGSLCRGLDGERVADTLMAHAPSWLAHVRAPRRSGQLEQHAQHGAPGSPPACLPSELGEVFDALSTHVPLVLLLEDLQWADPATLDLLAILCSRRAPARLLILATYRAAEVSRAHPLRRVVGELLARPRVSSLALSGFDVRRVREYLSVRFPGQLASCELAVALHRSTGGNPLFLARLADDLVERSIVRERDGRWELTAGVDEIAEHLPDALRGLIDTQIDRLSTLEQHLVEVASVVGPSFCVGTLARALDIDADAVDSACESLANEHGLFQYLGTESATDGAAPARYGFQRAWFRSVAAARSSASSARAWRRKVREPAPSGALLHLARG